jgi:hypothetical protein
MHFREQPDVASRFGSDRSPTFARKLSAVLFQLPRKLGDCGGTAHAVDVNICHQRRSSITNAGGKAIPRRAKRELPPLPPPPPLPPSCPLINRSREGIRLLARLVIVAASGLGFLPFCLFISPIAARGLSPGIAVPADWNREPPAAAIYAASRFKADRRRDNKPG